MENSYRFFENKECQYYPCHKGIENMNCLFCYCPLYSREHCPGKPEFLERTAGGSRYVQTAHFRISRRTMTR